jgi:hypothetical protein
MDDQTIEKLLRKAPAPKAPDELLERLQADIRLSHAATANRTQWGEPTSFWKRWMPAVSFAVILLTCVVAIAVQTNVIGDLTRQNGELRATAQTLEDLQKQNADLQQMRNDGGELERLRNDAAELAKLREELAALRTQLQDIDKLREENQRLQADIASRQAAAGLGDESVLKEQKDKATSQVCMNNLRQIGLAFRMWADDNKDVYPRDFASVTNYLGNWKVFQCPSDKARNIMSWAQVASGDVSYKIVSSGPEVPLASSDVLLVQCPFHGNFAFGDGSVRWCSPEVQAKFQTSNGVTRFPRLTPEAAK